MTGRPRREARFFTGRPRTSTLVLIGLFLGVFTLYIWVRPVSTSAANVQPAVTPGPTRTYDPVPTRSPGSPAPAFLPTGTPAP